MGILSIDFIRVKTKNPFLLASTLRGWSINIQAEKLE
jgi:hypothetical protein